MTAWFDAGKLVDITDPGAKGFSVTGGSAASFFVVHKDGAVFAYRNNCPHTGAPMEWLPDQFLDMDNSFIQCALHGALFRVDDGHCLAGPCAGQDLSSLPLEVHDGHLRVDISGLQEAP